MKKYSKDTTFQKKRERKNKRIMKKKYSKDTIIAIQKNKNEKGGEETQEKKLIEK